MIFQYWLWTRCIGFVLSRAASYVNLLPELNIALCLYVLFVNVCTVESRFSSKLLTHFV